jgi:hypothetical protein
MRDRNETVRMDNYKSVGCVACIGVQLTDYTVWVKANWNEVISEG